MQSEAQETTAGSAPVEHGSVGSARRGVLTYNDIVLTQDRHLPQGLVGEAVEVVGAILPLAPALLPASLHQLIWEDSQGSAEQP